MRAYIESVSGSSDSDKIIDQAEAVAVVSNRLCAIMDDQEAIPEGMVRIPLQVALSYLERDGTEWISPETSTEARALLRDLSSSLIDKINMKKESEDMEVSLAGVEGKPYRKSLVDVRRARQAKRERFERWDQ